MKQKTIIFDMDGVLVDSEWQYHLRMKEFLKENQVFLSEDVMSRLIGMSWDNMVSLILSSSKIGWTAEEFNRRLEEHNKRIGRLHYDTCIFQDTRETLQALETSGYRLALASSSEEIYVRQMLEDCGLEEKFQVVLSHKDVKRSKPDPEIYLKAAEKLGVSPQECIAVEDSFYGIAAAKGAGMTVVALRPLHYEIDQSAADLQIDHLKELLQLGRNTD